MKPFFMVWNESQRAPTIKHEKYKDAKAEAERIALKHPGEKVHILLSIFTGSTGGVVWERPK